MVHIGQVAPQHGPRSEASAALWTVVHAHVVKLVPVDLDALQAVGVTAGNGDGVSHSVRTQETERIWRQRESGLSHGDGEKKAVLVWTPSWSQDLRRLWLAQFKGAQFCFYCQ